MILAQIKAYGFMALAILFGTLLGLQTWRLHTSQLAEAKAITTLVTERGASATALAKAQAEVRSTEAGLQASASETRKATNVQVTSLTAQRDGLLGRVRLAEARANSRAPSPAAVASDREAATGGDGAELLATIGEEDVDEAKRGDLIRVHLQGCYRDYDAAVEALKAKR